MPFENVIDDEAGDGLRFSRSGRPLDDQLVPPFDAENGVFLAVVNRAASPREVVVDLWTDNAGLTGAELAALMELGLTSGKCLLTGEPCEVDEGLVRLSLPPESAYLFRLE